MDVFCGSPLWDTNLVWNTTNPDFTECFQQTILTMGPCIILWVLLPLVALRVKRSPRFYIPWTGLNVSKLMLSIILLIANAIILTYNASRINSDLVFSVDLVYPIIECCTYILVLILDVTLRRKGIHSSAILFIFWLLKTIGGIIIFRSALLKALSEENEISTTLFAMRVVIFPLIAAQLILNAFADTVISAPKLQQNPCPKKLTSPLGVAYYTYFDRLAWVGYKRNLLSSDLWSLDNIYKCSDVHSEFDARWCKERQRRAKDSIPSVLKIIWQMNKTEFTISILVKYIGDILGFVNPLMLKQLINFVTSDEPMWKGYLYAVTIFVSASMASLCMNNHFYRSQQIGIRARAAVISAIYRKALRLSNSAKKTTTVGEIVNLMSVDSQKIMDVWQFVGHGFSMPLQVGIALYLLWGMLGPAVLVGVIVIILMIPINAYLAGKTSKIQVQLMRYKDQRTKLMTEILGGIKVLKLYAWEMPFYDLVNTVRAAELLSLKKILYLQAITTFLFQCTPFLISLTTFATYVLIDSNNILDATTAFVSLSLFDIIRVPLNFVPMVVAIVVQAHVSVKRIDKFMRSDEIDPNVVTNDLTEQDPVVVDNATFTWGDEEPILQDISFRVPHERLVAVVGTVGSGKSSLISAILGEMDKTRGKVNTQGQIAYVSQQAWIQNATLKNNILFGKKFYPDKYNNIVEACALRQDLDILPGGDQTEIGEKGINLSGGQKQRVSLARALYSDSDVFLFDDPLSAVDSHVGKHIFDNVIGPKGLLKHKTRVLVTHGIAYLPYVDTIIVLSNGRVSEIGTYKELLGRGGEFAEFIMTYLKDEESLSDVEMAELIEMQEGILTEIKDERVKRRLSERITKALSSDDEAYVSPGSNKIRKRKKSSMSGSVSEVEQPKPSAVAKLTQQEQMEIGTVDWAVYIHYIKSIGYVLFFVSIAILTLAWSASVGSNIWLSIWSTDKPLPNGEQNTGLRDLRLGVYGALGFAQAIFAFVASIMLACATIRASKLLHNTMLSRVFHSPMSFFDTTPLGRIVNRFSRDVDVTDISIPTFLRPVLDCFLQIVGTVVVISIGSPIFLAIFFPLMIFYYLIQRLYIDVSRQLKRLESVSRSPIYSHFSETLSGLPTVRAFHKQDSFIAKLEETVDYNHILYYPILVAKRWLGIRLDAIGEIIVLVAGLFAVIGRETMDPGTVGLSVSYALSITFILMWLVRNWTDLETNIVSVERMKEYMELDMEAPWEMRDVYLMQQWPQNGEVHFEKYSTCYREGLDLVLRGISGHISSREKIGIVGRTGAGKSSLTLALFRIIEATDGFISIDGVNISRIGLHDLRSRLTIIPQDPVLFFGSLRMNLDPFSKYSDEDVWRALELSHLKEFVVSLPAGLEHEIVEGGENLSVGQRQLVCLARALLRKTKVLILDEATAAVDLETDDLIQATIRKEFSDCTIITIAHRLNTIMDSDRVMVLQNGIISEFDSPSVLLQSKDSIFYSMAKDAGLV